MTSEEPSNVRAFRGQGDQVEPEEILRNALSDCAEMRARGAVPFLVLLIGEDDYLPKMGRSRMSASDVLACAKRLDIEATRVMETLYDGEEGE